MSGLLDEIEIPINEEFDVTPDSLYPQKEEYMSVETFKMDLGLFAEEFYCYLTDDVKEGDIRPIDTPEFDKLCSDYAINKKALLANEEDTSLEGAILTFGAKIAFDCMPAFRKYFIDKYEEDILKQEVERQEQAEYEAQMAEQEAEAKAFNILKKLLPNIVKTEVIKAQNEGFIFIAERTKVYVKQGTEITNEEFEALEVFRIDVEVDV